MDFILGFLLGAGWWLVIPLALLIAVLEHNDYVGWSFIFTIPAIVAIIGILGLNSTGIIWFALAYVPVGIGCSLVRWKLRCSEAIKFAASKPYMSNVAKDSLKRKIELNSDNVGRLVSWVVTWPFGIVEVALGALFDVVGAIVDSIADKTYRKWSEDAKKRIDEAL